jgi:hypothetical protein
VLDLYPVGFLLPYNFRDFRCKPDLHRQARKGEWFSVLFGQLEIADVQELYTREAEVGAGWFVCFLHCYTGEEELLIY